MPVTKYVTSDTTRPLFELPRSILARAVATVCGFRFADVELLNTVARIGHRPQRER